MQNAKKNVYRKRYANELQMEMCIPLGTGLQDTVLKTMPDEGGRAELKVKESFTWQESFRAPWNADTSKVAAGYSHTNYMGTRAKWSRASILENCSVPPENKYA